MTKIKKIIIVFSIALVSLLVLNLGFSFAKYAANSFWDFYLKSKNFYFSSDYLTSPASDHVNNLWDGGIIALNLKNSANDKAITKEPINYEVTCNILNNVDATCQINETDNSITGTLEPTSTCVNSLGDSNDVSSYDESACLAGGYTFELAPTVLEFRINIIPDPGVTLDDVIFNVTAISTSPYQKTLSGNFTLKKAPLLSNNHLANFANDLLTVTNPTSNNKCLNLSFNPQNIAIAHLPSEFSSYQTTSGNISEVKFNINALSSKSYRFYNKNEAEPPTVESFTITETTGC